MLYKFNGLPHDLLGDQNSAVSVAMGDQLPGYGPSHCHPDPLLQGNILITTVMNNECGGFQMRGKLCQIQVFHCDSNFACNQIKKAGQIGFRYPLAAPPSLND